MPGAIAVRSCGVMRAAVYKRRPPERTAGWLPRAVWWVTFGGVRVGVFQAPARCSKCCGLRMLFYESCAGSASLSSQSFPNIEQM